MDILVSARFLPIAEADERVQSLALPFVRRNQTLASALKFGSPAEDRRTTRRQLAFPNAKLRRTVDRPAVEQTFVGEARLNQVAQVHFLRR
ncbi:hypothetical protein IB265_14630 [Ensifer sp. ENS10]|uniref:hypothetical protein n=1 Tax=Ensifer sp. ENS10 TaxID=2769286 RepID=UPI0019A61802|nr:hypothetical protein [Ensifer sp. ENS10]MBD9508019.1 hypothetical protein [Ensifer sp. ENS10]